MEKLFLGAFGDRTAFTQNRISGLFYGGNDTIYHLSTGTAAFAGSMLTPYVNAHAAKMAAGKPVVTEPVATESAGKTTVVETIGEFDEVIGDLEDSAEIRTFTSKAPLVGEVATEIEQNLPGRVTSVNKIVYRADGSILTDLDIELDNIIIQVKTGGGKGMTKQLINSADNTGKIAVGYVPGVKPSVLMEATNNDFQVFTNMDDLIEFISRH